MKKGYWISQVKTIHDMDLFMEYFDATKHLVERGDYKAIYGGEVKHSLEGDPIMFGIVIEFSSVEGEKILQK